MKLWFFFIVLLTIPFTYADVLVATYDTNQPITIYDGKITIQNIFFQTVVTNATLIPQTNPITGTNNTAFYEYDGSGWFFYRVNTSDGVYYGSGYTSGGDNMTAIAIVLSLLGICAYLIYASKDMLQRPKPLVDKSVYRLIRPENISVFLYLLAGGIVVVLFYFMHQMAMGQTYEPAFEALYIAGIFSYGAFAMVYVFIYVIYLVKEHLQKANKR